MSKRTKETMRRMRARRSFTDEFKAGAVNLVLDKGKTVSQVARDLDLTASALGKWVEQAKADAHRSSRGTLTTEEKDELAKLRREVRELRVERDIPKKLPCTQPVDATLEPSRARAACVGRALKVSRSGFYAWKGRSLCERSKQDSLLALWVAEAHALGRGKYGSPRVHREFEEAGNRGEPQTRRATDAGAGTGWSAEKAVHRDNR